MRFFGALSTERDSHRAAEQATQGATAALDGATPDLGFLFFSHHHVPEIDAILEQVAARTGVQTLLGCTGESIIGGGREVEKEASLSLWLASMPGVRVTPFEVRCEQTPDGYCFPCEPEGLFDEPDETLENPSVILLGEPFSMPVDTYLRRFNEDHPGLTVVGGMASGGTQPESNLIVSGGKVHKEGAVGVLLTGPYRMNTVVSQGCRPVGVPLVVTDCDRNTIVKLGGRPGLERLQETYAGLSPEDRKLFQQAPHVGIVMNERQEKFGPGDFLIRNLIGIDPDRGVVFVSDYLRRGQTVQFHVRDGDAASADLTALLEKDKHARDGSLPQGGLVFSCNGRGTRLFARPDHDVSLVHDSVGDIPVAGFFAQGEVGPVGDRNHLHGFTACVALFSEE